MMQHHDRASLERMKDRCTNSQVRIQSEVVSDLTHEINENALMRKVDLTLLPWLCFVYLLCFLDRVGIGNARVSV